MLFAFASVTTEVAIEMLLSGAVSALTLLCTGSKVRRSNDKNSKRK